MYEYIPLPSANSIRLLHLQPGSLSLPVRCLISIYEIDQAPAFQALSYTWGQEIKHRIGCDNVEYDSIGRVGRFLSIHENLWLALQRLRHETEERVLWIDAICINQMENAEKNVQVPLMRKLFEKADSVIVWLGEESKDSTAAFDLISRLVAAAITELESSSADTKKVFQARDLGLLALPEHSDPAWKALDALFWRPWFSRVWVIQEIIVARDASVLCGSSHCQWLHLTVAARYITDHSLTAITLVEPRRLIKFLKFDQRFREGPPYSLLELLSEARDTYSTDDRDKVFALLDIAEDARYSLLKPNYKQPLVDVYTTLTKHLMKRDRSLDILSAIEEPWYRLKRNRKPDREIEGLEENELPMNSQLPSWVPDWEVHKLSSSFLLHPAFPTMRAAGTSQTSCSFSVDGLTLFCRGLAFDQVRHVGIDFSGTVPAPGSLSLNFLQFPSRPKVSSVSRLAQTGINMMLDDGNHLRLREWEKMARDLKTYPTGENVLDTFIHTLVANDPLILCLPLERRRACYTAWRKYWYTAGARDPKFIHESYERSSTEEIELANQFLQSQLKAAYGRRFFTTSKGYMGLCQSRARIGYRVVILYGGKTPYLLKKIGRRGYEFKGECFIHGLMNGEALSKSIPEQVFAIH